MSIETLFLIVAVLWIIHLLIRGALLKAALRHHGRQFWGLARACRELGYRVIAAEDAVKANHEWHLQCDDVDGYAGSDLFEQNTKVIAAAEGPKA